MTRSSKYHPLVEEVELVNCNPQYACVRFPNGKEETVSLRYLAPKVQNISDFCLTDSIEGVAAPQDETQSHSIDPPGGEQFTEQLSEIPENIPQYVTDKQRVRPYNRRNRGA
ncbi:hypothetical protein CRM22_002267 [Opisthorchis felineus]|uniref:Uncharacterized protein n=1 Tax=Opisthorchis felineus TaxID=147828 RepID=A0A4S2MBD2_OPIFE|nr:hypothetical protein CRM22_002267 [Opisthorchis felineus]